VTHDQEEAFTLADRVAVLDGALSVRRTSGEGTTVCAVIPVRPHTDY